MTLTAPIRNPAQAKLDDLAHCKGIVRFQAGDDEVLCGSCLIPIVSGPGGFQHDPAAIRRLRETAMDGAWPRG